MISVTARLFCRLSSRITLKAARQIACFPAEGLIAVSAQTASAARPYYCIYTGR